MAIGLYDLLSKQRRFTPQDDPGQKPIQVAQKKSKVDLKELEVNVRSILVSAGKPCRVSEIEKDYRGLFGQKFPFWELGFSNVKEVLKNLPEACVVQDDADPDSLVSVKTTEKNVHIFELVRKSKALPKSVRESKLPVKVVFVPFNVQDGMRELLYRKRSIRKTEFLKMLENRFDMKYFNLDVSVQQLIRCLPHLLLDDGPFVKSAYIIEEDEVEISEYLHFDGEYIIPSYRLSKLEVQIAQNIYDLIVENRSIKVMDIPHCYVKKFGKELNWYSFGFQDLWRFLQLLPGRFGLFKVDGSYFATSPDLEVEEAVDVHELKEEQFCGQNVYIEVLYKIRRLILQVNVGLNANHFESTYEALYYEKLVIKKDLRKFLFHLEALDILKIRDDGNSTMLLPSKTSSEEDIAKRVRLRLEPEVKVLNVVKSTDSLPTFNFGVINVNMQRFCAAYVTSIESPNDFYIRMIGIGENHDYELEEEFVDLMEDMQECYLPDIDRYIIPIGELRLDMVCAACCDGKWRRIVILDILNQGIILVRSVDYGKTHRVKLNNIRYLLNRFATLPVMAYRASLFNIGSGVMPWTLKAVTEFRRLTMAHTLQPLPLSVVIVHCSKEGLLRVVLTRVVGEKELHIGDKLVDLGLASFTCSSPTFMGLFS